LTIQLTIIRIDDYGPYTLTLGSDREAQLQMLQAKIYYDIQWLFSEKGGIVYPNRFDEFFAITNGLSINDHIEIQNNISELHKDLNLSMTIGNGITPYDANINAYTARKTEKLLSKEKRIFGQIESSWSSLSSTTRSSDIMPSDDFAQILHIDVDRSAKISSTLSPYDITCLVIRIYDKLSEEFLRKGLLTFFLGGDNFMVISNTISKVDAEEIIKKMTMDLGVKLNCGMGIGRTGKKAAEAATKALDTIRDLRDRGNIQSIYEIKCLW
jgi:GTP cyclohydrolase IIa